MEARYRGYGYDVTEPFSHELFSSATFPQGLSLPERFSPDVFSPELSSFLSRAYFGPTVGHRNAGMVRHGLERSSAVNPFSLAEEY